MKQTRLRPISKKRAEEMRKYFPLVEELRQLCDNRSELSGDIPGWPSNFQAEPHHIEGRSGKRLLDLFNIIMLTRTEHDTIRQTHTKEELLALVRDIRIKQGLKEV